ncbi:ribosome biogenesis GTPase Der [Succinispira mobilis]|uniref:ribosome biogenesis GTPase Der n=1 Tax=Succinispira mobilis TaxID=78120 RepID=UPI00036F7D75|nr:ribosome biogenesis GTPase Der [Succinispira mobilis]
MSKPIVAFVGRPNVGKSTLFNAIANKQISIVEDTPGVTRDRLYATAEWLNQEFMMIDTGGIETSSQDQFIISIREQAQIAMQEADVIVFVVDARTGMTSDDEDIAKILRQTKKPVVLAVNKVDSPKQEMEMYEFYNLGLGDVMPISASNRYNLGDLLDAVVDGFPKLDTDASGDEEDEIKVALIGRPNVGKSSVFNAVIGKQRSIVSDVAGTTRDAIDTKIEREGVNYVFIDTAGMRRKARVDEPVEKYSVIRSLRAIDRSDVVLMVLDASEGILEQDKKIAGYAHEAGKATVFVVNKWDLYEKDNTSTLRFTEEIRNEFAFLQYAPVVFVSALTKQRIHRLPEVIHYVAEQHAMRVATGVLNQVIQEAISINPPPSDKGVKLKILYVTQVKTKPPTFVFFVNQPNLMHFSYQRYMENKLRDAFGFEGTPLHIIVRGKESEE